MTTNIDLTPLARRRVSLVCFALLPVFGVATPVRAQAATKPGHPPVCAEGVKQYEGFATVPTPFDTLQMPPAAGPIRVTNDEEARAADYEMRKRAGSVGANGLVVVDKVEEGGGGQSRISRQATAIFVLADSARVREACKK